MINSKNVWEIRDSIMDIMKKMNSRVRIVGKEIEVDINNDRRCSSSVRFKVLKSNTHDTLMRIIHSGYDMDGKYFTRNKEMSLPTADVNKLFYSIAQH